jgi:RNA polymerase sigma factor (TIGR02999 family)
MPAPDTDITELLRAAATGDGAAESELFRVLYAELKSLASARLAREFGANTLSATGLVHEAYLRLTGSRLPEFNDRRHFMAIAATVMRRVLVDRARSAGRSKRGDGLVALTLDDAQSLAVDARDLIELDDALQRLFERDPMMARVVELRYFAGLDVEQTAAALDSSPRSVNRAWTAARAWLLREMG